MCSRTSALRRLSLYSEFLAQRVGRQPAFQSSWSCSAPVPAMCLSLEMKTSGHVTQKAGLLSTSSDTWICLVQRTSSRTDQEVGSIALSHSGVSSLLRRRQVTSHSLDHADATLLTGDISQNSPGRIQVQYDNEWPQSCEADRVIF